MMYKNEITITREEFHDTIGKIMYDLSSNSLDDLKFAMLCAKAEVAFFGGEDDDTDTDTDTEAPFNVGDKVFVIDDDGDGNRFVNQVVTVLEVKDNYCEVANKITRQGIYFHNLRKVKTP